MAVPADKSSSSPTTSLNPGPPAPARLPTPPRTPDSETATTAPVSSQPSSQVHATKSSVTSSESVNTFASSHSRKEYMESLVPPSKEEFEHIAEVQNEREAELKQKKRMSRDAHRRSLGIESRRRQSTSRSSAPSESSSPKMAATTHYHRGSISEKLHSLLHHEPTEQAHEDSHDKPDEIDGLRAKAAVLIQRTYRGYRARRQMKGLGIDASTRWTQALREARWCETTRPRARSELLGGTSDGDPAAVDMHAASARQKWKKAATIALRAAEDMDAADDDESSGESSSSAPESDAGDDDEGARRKRREDAKRRREEARAQRRKDARMMGLQYFLEMVDLKHRYGSNLRTYHEEWKRADTNENFFYWLDFGEGRYIDIEACPRERLDREQVRYLSWEERQYYLVKVDEDGRLCWAKNGARIDTTEKYKDSIHGIVPADDPTPAFQPVTDHPMSAPDRSRSAGNDTDSDSDDASESELEAARAAKYATPGLDEAHGMTKIRHLSAATIFNKLLRKSVRKNTWIFVADTSFRLYVGIKASGAFQHSSFLQGGRISAAGLIKVKDGRLVSLSPLSGHYRPPASNFRAFVRSLREGGVDMSRVSISKSYAVLVGLEMYVKTRRKGKDLVRRLAHRKDKILAPDEARRREEAARDTSESAARERAFLKEQERQREENKAGVELMRKLKLSPREPRGQKGGEDTGAEANALDVAIEVGEVPNVEK